MNKCPKCESPDPKKHPAVQFEGEVHLCRDPWHKPTAEEIEREDGLRRNRATRLPSAIYLWIVPSEHELDQPGSWRIRKWDTEPFPEATHTASTQLSAKVDTCDIGHKFAFLPDHPRKDGLKRCPHCMAAGLSLVPSATTDRKARVTWHEVIAKIQEHADAWGQEWPERGKELARQMYDVAELAVRMVEAEASATNDDRVWAKALRLMSKRARFLANDRETFSNLADYLDPPSTRTKE